MIDYLQKNFSTPFVEGELKIKIEFFSLLESHMEKRLILWRLKNSMIWPAILWKLHEDFKILHENSMNSRLIHGAPMENLSS